LAGLLLFPLAGIAAPQTFTFAGNVSTRYQASADVTYPPEIYNQLPVTGSLTVDVALVNPENTSGLAFLGRYELLSGAATFEMEADGGLQWAFSSDPDDVLGQGAEQKNDLRVVNGNGANPDSIRLQFWDPAPAQDVFALLEENQAGLLIVTATDNNSDSQEITDINPPAAVPDGWIWSGDMVYVEATGGLLYGFQFSMNAVIVNPGFGTIGMEALGDNQFAITWEAEAGFNYALQSTRNFQTWQPEGDLTGALGARTTVFDAPADNPATVILRILRTEQ
jgi:hypothetical protein